MADSLEDEVQDLKSMSVGIPDCEGLPWRLWNMNCVTLYNEQGRLDREDVCHSIKSDLVVGTNGPLGDNHIAIHIYQSHSGDDNPQDLVYTLVAWPIKLVHYHGASLHDHEVRDRWNQLQATLTNPPSLKSRRPYTSVIQNLPQQGPMKYKDLMTKESINLVSSKVCCLKNCV